MGGGPVGGGGNPGGGPVIIIGGGGGILFAIPIATGTTAVGGPIIIGRCAATIAMGGAIIGRGAPIGIITGIPAAPIGRGPKVAAPFPGIEPAGG